MGCARSEGTGRELYTSDGTAEGTRLVADLYPGPGDGVRAGTFAATANNRFFFYGDNGSSGLELFVVNGCPGDFDNDGAVGVQDLLGFVGAYVVGAAGADVDAVAGVSVEDLFVFLGSWFGGCGG